VIAGVNVVAADTNAVAEAHLLYAQRRRVSQFLAPGRSLSDDDADALVSSRAGRQVLQMMEYTAVGDARAVARYLAEFAAISQADELIVTLMSPTLDDRLHAATILASIGDRPAVLP
jgi:alkanesulfonate monooxygenase SsuD/methylene tetrahydromethanopterin reductase-like flavin-dependent oxidoreductase (luciferase family)